MQEGGGSSAAQLAIDGVSCTVCHRIAGDRLGEPSTFSGRFPLAQRPLLGDDEELN